MPLPCGDCIRLLRGGHGELRTLGDAFWPALHDRLLFGVEAHPLFAIGVRITKQALLPASKTMPRHGHRQRHVDAYHTDLDAPTELTRHVTVTGETSHAVAELMVVDQLHGGPEIRYSHAGQHWAEDLFFVDTHIGRNMIEQRTAHPEAALTAVAGLLALEVSAVSQQLCTVLHARLDVFANARMRGSRHDGPHLSIQVGAVEYLQVPRALQQLGHDLVGDIAYQYCDRDRHAALAGRPVTCADECINYLVDICIGHDHHVVLRPPQGLNTLALARASLVDVVGYRSRAHERHRFHIRVGQQRIHRFLVALNHVEDAIRQAGLFKQLGHEQAGAWVGRTGFEDKRVSRGDRDREHPHWYHHRKVERRDTSHHTQRLSDRPVIQVSRYLIGEVALEQLRDATGELHDIDTTRHLAHGIGKHLAMFGSDHVGQRLLVLVQQLEEFEQHARPADRRGVGPLGECSLGRCHRAGDVLGTAQAHFRGDLAGGRVEHRLGTDAIAGDKLPMNVLGNFWDMADGGHDGSRLKGNRRCRSRLWDHLSPNNATNLNLLFSFANNEGMKEKNIDVLWAHLHWLVILEQQGSYTAAASRLGVSKAAMSQRIAELERAVGMPLVRRTTRSMRLTEVGQRLVEEVRMPFERIAHSFTGVRDLTGEATGLLRVTAPVALARQQLVPRLAEFSRANPQVRLELELSDRISSLSMEGFDLAIRHAASVPDTHVAWQLCTTRTMLVASRDYLRCHKAPSIPQDLSEHACLYYPRAQETPTWAFEPAVDRTNSERTTVAVRGPFAANNSEALRDAAIAGLGIALLPDFSAQAALQAGNLVEVLPEWVPVGTFAERLYAVRPYAPHVPLAVSTFVQFLREAWESGFPSRLAH